MFSNKFSPEKAPPRKAVTVSILNLDAGERAREFGLDYNSAEMVFENQRLKLDPKSGKWMSSEAKGSLKPAATPNEKEAASQQPKETDTKHEMENNLLKVKNEILLDMVAEFLSETLLIKNEK